jgi:exopolysaccharide biosynthesis polyprenyl glycosylphosphotransferase
VNVKELKNNFREDVLNIDIAPANIPLYIIIKSVFDVIIAFIGLIVASPIILLFCLLIKLESRGPIFFLQERVGLNGKLFYIIKLRSMNIDAEKNGAQWAMKNDPRVTRVGSFIRKTRIDELPQLINILKGEMSLIGPRPERLVFTEKFNKDISGFYKRLAIKPGITGWAQVNGGYNSTPREKLSFDLYYIQNMGILIDLLIVIRTLKVIITGEGAR